MNLRRKTTIQNRSLSRTICILALTALVGVVTAVRAHAATAESAAKIPARPLWSYQTELGLSDKQCADMKAIFKRHEDLVTQRLPRLQTLNDELSTMLATNAPLEEIKPRLAEFYQIQFELKWSDIKTSRELDAVVTPEQLAHWRKLQQEAQRQKP